MFDYVQRLFTDWLELHGDRSFADDQALIGGLARFDGERVMLIGQQKGRSTKEIILRSFGMPRPEGYRKALRLMKLAERFDRPVIAFIDTPGAYPGIDAEERGQAEAIAVCLEEMAALQVPVISVVIGEGGSGGALAIGVCNRLLMLQYSWYSVISPESCAAILYRDSSKGEKAAEALKLTARDAYELGIVDELVEEASGGAHRDPDITAQNLGGALRRHLRALRQLGPGPIVDDRYAKVRKLGPVTQPGAVRARRPAGESRPACAPPVPRQAPSSGRPFAARGRRGPGCCGSSSPHGGSSRRRRSPCPGSQPVLLRASPSSLAVART